MKPAEAAIRKRSQIAKANRTMFLWIAVASALVGAAVVVSIFLANNLIYNERVLAAKQETVTTLENNIEIVETLKQSIVVLDTDTSLASVKANPNDQAVQVILDALPAEANSLAFGASLQNKLLAVDGLTLTSLQVDPVVGVETLSDMGAVTEEAPTEGASGQITFKFVATGSQDAVRQVLENLERSIRTVLVTSVAIETQTSGPQVTVQGKVFYEPAKKVELKEVAVPR